MMSALQEAQETFTEVLSTPDETILVQLSQEVAETLLKFIQASTRGCETVFIEPDTELSPNKAAKLLKVSRPHVRKLMKDSQLAYCVVGSRY